MSQSGIHVVTGAFGYSGSYIARLLLEEGTEVRTLTNTRPETDPFQGRIPAFPLSFDNEERLAESLRGASVLYNTYWVRFNYGWFNHAAAVENTLALFRAAQKAGVGRIVHVSITNPSVESPFEYFWGKARLEKALVESGISHAILRPAVLFGGRDILVNNIAWALRRLPVFGVFGDGNYRLQPIFVEDFARLAVEQGRKRDNAVINAIGPETFTYRELVKTLAAILGKRRLIISVPPVVGFLAGMGLSALVGDVMITWEEIGGLMADLLYADAPPAGTTKLTGWAEQHAGTLGRHYASELARRKRTKTA